MIICLITMVLFLPIDGHKNLPIKRISDDDYYALVRSS